MFKMRFPGGLKKTFTLSYDDNLYDDIRLMELMQKHGIKGTFNLSSDINRPDNEAPEGRWPRMTLAEAEEQYPKYGVEVAVHGLQHRDFTKITEPELYYEISADKANLELRYNRVIRGAAYPYGSWNQTAIEALKKCGIKYCRTVWCDQSFAIPSGDGWLALKATCHHNVPNLMELAKNFIELDPNDCKMFYVWGHTAEFRNDNNWNVIEELLEFVSGREDIWYATNIDICEYCLAYEKLEYSTAPNSNIVYNPTAKEIWLELWGKVFSVKPGETVRI